MGEVFLRLGVTGVEDGETAVEGALINRRFDMKSYETRVMIYKINNVTIIVMEDVTP